MDWEPQRSDGPGTVISPQCRNCGSYVSESFARVFGDNDDRIHHCLHCSTARERASWE